MVCRVTPTRSGTSLAVHAPGQGLQAAVDLYRDDPMARAEPTGKPDGRDEVGPRRRAGEDALGPGGLSCHGESVGLGYRHHLVNVGELKLRRAPAGAAPLDVVGPGRTAGEHR